MQHSRRPAEADLIHVVGAALVRGQRCLVARRSATMRAALQWEFPGGKVERGETPEGALTREIQEELGVHIEVVTSLGVSVNAPIRLEVFLARIVGGTPMAREHDRLLWASAEELCALELAAPDVPLLPAVLAALRQSSEL